MSRSEVAQIRPSDCTHPQEGDQLSRVSWDTRLGIKAGLIGTVGHPLPRSTPTWAQGGAVFGLESLTPFGLPVVPSQSQQLLKEGGECDPSGPSWG